MVRLFFAFDNLPERGDTTDGLFHDDLLNHVEKRLLIIHPCICRQFQRRLIWKEVYDKLNPESFIHIL